jgi:hypothetical protein
MARQGEDMTRRIALSDSLADGRGRFLVGGQATQAASGEIKMYEWRKEVSTLIWGLLISRLARWV